MKRVGFKTEFVPRILDGSKRFTSRWRPLPVKAGEVVAAVSRQGRTPAHLVPASKAFAHVRFDSHEEKRWADFTEEDAARCGVTRDWYLRERPGAPGEDTIHVYGFTLEERAAHPLDKGEGL